MPTCDIIIPIWNQPALTRRCLDSVRAETEDYRLLLIDNGSEAPTRELLEAAARTDPARVIVIRNADNLGFIKAVNQGMRASNAPYVVLLNNDTVVAPGWLQEMLAVAASDAATGLVNPSSNTLGYAPAAATPEAILAYAASLTGSRGHTREMAMAVGFCLLIKRAVLDAVGLFDERYGMGNFEDADFSLTAQAAGYRAVQAVGAYVYHEEKASFKRQAGWERAFQANQRAFHERWGRALRILWISHSPAPDLTPAVVRLLRQGHQLWIRAEEGAPEEILRYTSASRLAANPFWYVLRRRKKPVDLVISDDARLCRWLQWTRPLHRAAVLARPTPNDLEKACRTLSRSL